MGVEQGLPSGYEHGPAAEVGGVPTEPRRLTNHYFAGPDHSIVHPGIFPHNVDAARLATLEEWLEFDYEAGWGTDRFEDNLPEDATFPARWASIDDRYDARGIIEDQLELLEWARQKRREVLRNGFQIGDVIATPPRLSVATRTSHDSSATETTSDSPRLRTRSPLADLDSIVFPALKTAISSRKLLNPFECASASIRIRSPLSMSIVLPIG